MVTVVWWSENLVAVLARRLPAVVTGGHGHGAHRHCSVRVHYHDQWPGRGPGWVPVTVLLFGRRHDNHYLSGFWVSDVNHDEHAVTR
jgi:hypothetical protein